MHRRTPESDNTKSPGSELDRRERSVITMSAESARTLARIAGTFDPENAMKIVYDISSKDVVRMDAIVLAEGEFPICSPRTLAFRGDDRPPSNIFSSGFKKREPNYTVRGTASVLSSATAPLKWSDILGTDEWGFAQLKSRDTIVRDRSYRLEADEVVFRPNHLDLLQQTCVSLSLDFELVTGFPLTDGTTTYSYILELPNKVLPTYKIQADGGNSALATSREVTCNLVPADNIIGAAEIKRTKTGSDAMCTVNYRIVKWWRNLSHGGLMEDHTEYLIDKLEKLLGKKITLEGEKSVTAGMKSGVSTESNSVLQRAVQALNKHITIEGGLTGMPASRLPKKGSEGAKGHQRRGSFSGHSS
jgi:hypothetical protein